MKTPAKIKAPKFLMPRDDEAVGPQNDAERRLYQLVMEGIDNGPSLKTTIAELTSELRVRIRTKR